MQKQQRVFNNLHLIFFTWIFLSRTYKTYYSNASAHIGLFFFLSLTLLVLEVSQVVWFGGDDARRTAACLHEALGSCRVRVQRVDNREGPAQRVIVADIRTTLSCKILIHYIKFSTVLCVTIFA